MNRVQLHEQIKAAAIRFTDEIVGYFGEALQSVVKDVTLGVPAAAPKPAARAVGRPRGVAKAKAPAKPAKAAKPAPKPAKPEKAAKPGRPAKAAKKAPAKPAAKTAAPPKSGRRTVSELDAAAERVHKLLASRSGGMRIEEINKQLGTSTRELMRPIKKLLSNKQIRKSGERRSTTYFAS